MPDLLQSLRRNEKTNLYDLNDKWRFYSENPETLLAMTMLYSDRGTPDGFRHMHGHSGHTYKWINKDGKVFYVKYHFVTD
jgi:catalase